MAALAAPGKSAAAAGTPGGVSNHQARQSHRQRAAFLALRRQADGRTTAEYLQALEGFLLPLAHPANRSRPGVQGGVLLTAYDLRRPIAGIDVAALRAPDSAVAIRQLVVDVAAIVLPAEFDAAASPRCGARSQRR